MSLKGFHILFISLSSLLAFAFGGWSLHFSRANEDGAFFALSLASFAAGVVLIVYGYWFWRKITTTEEEKRRRRKRIHTVPVMIALWLLSHRAASACAVCYGDAEGPMIEAARLGVWLLFGLVGAVQLAFVLFFVQLWRRARRHRY